MNSPIYTKISRRDFKFASLQNGVSLLRIKIAALAKPLTFAAVFLTLTSCSTYVQPEASVAAIDPIYALTIETDGNKHVYTTEELLARDDLEVITIRDVSAYPRTDVTFTSLKFATLLQRHDVANDATVEFIAFDGFTAPLFPQLLLNTSPDGAIAYLAIENPQEKWPSHRSGDGTAGPFYLFWVNPELSNIGREEWPYKFNQVVVKGPLESLYPELVPNPSARNYPTLNAGFKQYVRNCITCHKLDRVGPGTMGPDLNYPLSPFEYFREGILRQFIRNPQSIRANPTSPMGGFSKALISDTEMDQLLAYLKYMQQTGTVE